MAEIQDEPFDGAAEGLTAPDEHDLAQDLADRQAAESRTEPAEEEDLIDEKFAYTLPDGKEIEGTLEEIAEAVAEAKVAEKLAEAKPAEKPAEAPVVPQESGYEPVQWEGVGDNFQAMLEGDQGGAAAIGPAFRDVTIRTIATEPVVNEIVTRRVIEILKEFAAYEKQDTSFKDFVGDEPTEVELAAFRKDNPWARTKEMAVVGVKAAKLQKEISDLKAGKPATEKAAKAAGAKETLANLKAKGTLRRVTPGRAAAPGAAPQGKPKNEAELIHRTVDKIKAMRQGH